MSPGGPSGGAAGGRVSDLSILMADIFQQQEEEEGQGEDKTNLTSEAKQKAAAETSIKNPSKGKQSHHVRFQDESPVKEGRKDGKSPSGKMAQLPVRSNVR